ncbi:MAG: outer membrane protein assembly factor BamD [Bdellovibrionales bacterium]|nr:outer membrane protein assembly factor BamD [Bdellovibrionales bacterium]
MKRILLFSLLLFGCSSMDQIDTSTPEGAFKMAEKYADVERYEEAVTRFNEVRTKFPYSKYSVEAQLRIADIQYKREYFVEAATAYQIFREYYPKHPKIEYIIYRIGSSYYQQLPTTVDRDLSAASEVLKTFNEYLDRFPSGEHAADAKEKKADTIDKLIEKELYIGNYYYKQKEYLSALGRYQGIYDKYSNYDQALTAAYKGFLCAVKLDYRDFAKRFYDILAKKYPKSDEYEDAKTQGEKYGLL